MGSPAERNRYERVSTLRRGEVAGIAGLMGAGRTELMRAIFGARPDRERDDPS